MIDSYDFGEVVIDGKRYTSDVIIYPDRVKGDWWRKEGHQLCIYDLEDVLDKEPDVIVVGTGNPGMMRVLPETEKLIKSKGIRLFVQPTKEACRTYNQLSSSQSAGQLSVDSHETQMRAIGKVIALLHLTC